MTQALGHLAMTLSLQYSSSSKVEEEGHNKHFETESSVTNRHYLA
jgi:hypothetical protein